MGGSLGAKPRKDRSCSGALVLVARRVVDLALAQSYADPD